MSTRLANEAWEALLTAHARLMRNFAQSPIWEAASMREYDVLYTLAKEPAGSRLADLGQRVLLSQPALSRLVDRLVDRGLVERTIHPGDGRAVLLQLTDAGREVQRSIGRVHAQDVTSALRRLDQDELRQLATLTRKLYEESS